jgi:hypothetical protein
MYVLVDGMQPGSTLDGAGKCCDAWVDPCGICRGNMTTCGTELHFYSVVSMVHPDGSENKDALVEASATVMNITSMALRLPLELVSVVALEPLDNPDDGGYGGYGGSYGSPGDKGIYGGSSGEIGGGDGGNDGLHGGNGGYGSGSGDADDGSYGGYGGASYGSPYAGYGNIGGYYGSYGSIGSGEAIVMVKVNPELKRMITVMVESLNMPIFLKRFCQKIAVHPCTQST